jgi:hypothetical protein
MHSRKASRSTRTFCVLVAVLILFALGPGCGEDATEPEDGWDVGPLAGAWDAVRIMTGDITTNLTSGNVYWHIDARGHFCEEYRLAYGYVSTGCGAVGSGRELHETRPDETTSSWQLTLSAESDTLYADLIAAAGPAPDRWVLVRGGREPAADCFCE